MLAQAHTCRLLEPDGTPLTSATYSILDVAPVCKAIVRAFDRPGRLIKRCVLDHLRDIRIQLANGAVVHGTVERVYFDPKHGRVCTVRLESRTLHAAASRSEARVSSMGIAANGAAETPLREPVAA